ncbi:MAG: hydrolase [Actinobacteria bacterium]|nr:hydrolase [Actinomycetota bacterium]
MSRSFLFLHGWRNLRPAGHWQYQSVMNLRSKGESVEYPAMPLPDTPQLEDWLRVFETSWTRMEGERVVVAHSLGTTLWFHAAARGFVADRVLLVAPAGPTFLQGEKLVSSFASLPTKLADPKWRVVCSDLDPFCIEGAVNWLAPEDHDVIPGGGHLALSDGYGDWPSLVQWCDKPETRIVGR